MTRNRIINVGFSPNFIGGGMGVYARSLIKTILQNFNGIVFKSFFSSFRDDYKCYLENDFPERYIVKTYKYPTKLIKFAQKSMPFSVFKKLAGDVDIYHSMGEDYPDFDIERLIVTAHGFLPIRFPELTTKEIVKYFKSQFLPMLQKAKKIIAPTKSIKKELINDYNIDVNRINVIYHGVNTDLFFPNKKMYTAKMSLDPYILYVGGIVPHKNVINIMKAFKKLVSEKRNLNHSLILAGSKAWHFKLINEAFNKLNSSNKMKYIGHLSLKDLSILYKGASVFVSPSIYESFGFPALEAMACGIPAIVSKDTGTAEIVKDGGILVNPYDVDEIAEAIFRIISDAEYRNELSKRAIKRAQNFSWERCAKETLDIYKEVLNNKL